MRINLLRRIEAAEQRVKQEKQPPAMIMIHFDDRIEKKWVVTKHYVREKFDPNNYRTEKIVVERLQDFFFPTAFRGRVILNTFASPDPAIYRNLFSFNIEDLRENQPGEIAIRSITGPEDDCSITVSINTYTKE